MHKDPAPFFRGFNIIILAQLVSLSVECPWIFVVGKCCCTRTKRWWYDYDMMVTDSKKVKTFKVHERLHGWFCVVDGAEPTTSSFSFSRRRAVQSSSSLTAPNLLAISCEWLNFFFDAILMIISGIIMPQFVNGQLLVLRWQRKWRASRLGPS